MFDGVRAQTTLTSGKNVEVRLFNGWSEYRRSDHFWTENFKISQIFSGFNRNFLLEISSTAHL